ncbi:MAG: hypothetical protein HYY06_11100 [Deltaproteobacteria bacterium]|nr:hypothetical protein [Deltaproteobacteria bacterium]
MATRLRAVLAGLLLASATAGCLGGPDPIHSHEEDLALGLPSADAPGAAEEVDALAHDLWLEGDACADAGMQAKASGHEVRWTLAGESGQLLFVEIDGILACAGDAGELDAGERAFLDLNRGTSPGQGGPEPEPADPAASGPEPEPANPDHGGCSSQNAAPGTGGQERQSGEGEGGPEPEPAFDGGDDGGAFAAGSQGDAR